MRVDHVVRILEQVPIASLARQQALLGPHALGDIADGAGHEYPVAGAERAQADLDRELTPVLAPRVEPRTFAQAPNAWIGKVTPPVLLMTRPETVRNQTLDRRTH